MCCVRVECQETLEELRNQCLEQAITYFLGTEHAPQGVTCSRPPVSIESVFVGVVYKTQSVADAKQEPSQLERACKIKKPLEHSHLGLQFADNPVGWDLLFDEAQKEHKMNDLVVVRAHNRGRRVFLISETNAEEPTLRQSGSLLKTLMCGSTGVSYCIRFFPCTRVFWRYEYCF